MSDVSNGGIVPVYCENCLHAVEYHGERGCDVEVRDYGDMDCGCVRYQRLDNGETWRSVSLPRGGYRMERLSV